MKLLLTSGGITNKSITDALFELVGKRPEDTSLVFVPTASNVEMGDKGWLINDLINLKKLNLKSINIADISAVGKDVWLPQFEEADILFFEGGDEYTLMEWINKSGLKELLPELLKTKVYVGLSAGTMVTNPDLSFEISQSLYDEDFDRSEDMLGLNYVDFYFLPHLNSQYFSKLREENIKKIVEKIPKKIYAMDDDGALKIVDGKVEIISEGKYLIFN
ncbi:MAG: Type 1 glutamine amidotransferase-like domain-containing protein [Candidatus Paceibacterota bacterium]|jgi:dipeptidase E